VSDLRLLGYKINSKFCMQDFMDMWRSEKENVPAADAQAVQDTNQPK
jgi:hypothetical protein